MIRPIKKSAKQTTKKATGATDPICSICGEAIRPKKDIVFITDNAPAHWSCAELENVVFSQKEEPASFWQNWPQGASGSLFSPVARKKAGSPMKIGYARISNCQKACTPAAIGKKPGNIRRNLKTAKNYTDFRIRDLSYKIRKLRYDANAGIASAMAVAGLPSASFGHTMFATSMSEYQGQEGFAAGVSTARKGLVIKAAGTVNTRGNGGFSAGFGYEW